jgi:zinc/manganese transport system substrate-binding protein
VRVVARVAADLGRLDPGHRAYFDARRTEYERNELGQYHDRIDAIRAKYEGVPVGASESIVTPLVTALGLRLLTPAAFLDAVAEGADPTARDKATADRQIRARQITVFLFNTQNATPDVHRLVDEARAQGIPVVRVTETLEPASATFIAWQIGQLDVLASALAQATGR